MTLFRRHIVSTTLQRSDKPPTALPGPANHPVIDIPYDGESTIICYSYKQDVACVRSRRGCSTHGFTSPALRPASVTYSHWKQTTVIVLEGTAEKYLEYAEVFSRRVRLSRMVMLSLALLCLKTSFFNINVWLYCSIKSVCAVH